MILLNVVDFGLGFKAHYYINQDGADPVEHSRLSNAVVTLAFIIVYLVAKTLISTVAGSL